ncbi:MAG: hypothetical protein RM022_006375 [Nostoc sp. EfeVER01]|uniref:hypothetical protein n=1 Tax=unclassified Nostoc TaxID=2593658 RepID=UPI002AD351F1|nr:MULTISPECIES: hypothetical protein [unclassified Nostoc]MDZ7948666.1 hypothetical protein [Nostoc sp. EfeVER01]MDZ7991143.1 hypothetical protein [Nostoc sp. EspVER01]
MFKSALIFSLIPSLVSFTQSSFDKYQILSPNFNSKNSLATLAKIGFQKKTTKENNPKLFEVEGFIFELIGCKSGGYNITKCDLAVENTLEKRTLQIVVNKTRIIDDAGNELVASQATFGSKKHQYGVSNDMSTNVPIRASVTFSGLLGEKINLLDISCYMQGTGFFNAEFKGK